MQNLIFALLPHTGLTECCTAVAEETKERLLDAVMLRLRMSDGLDLDWLARHFGSSAASCVEGSLKAHVESGLVKRRLPDHRVINSSAGSGLGCMRLDVPDGYLMSNDIISDAFLALDDVLLA